MDKPKMSVSFSGGRTSGYMAWLCKQQYGDTHDMRFTFANTGCEHEDTLRFVDECDRHFDLGVVWLEAVVSPEHGVGITFREVDYASASRNGEPYEAYIAKYGIPNHTSPQCTTRLKILPMEKYLASQGFLRGKKLNYDTAIGIRADEIDRVPSNFKEQRFVYPLIDRGVRKSDVLSWWKERSWDLRIPEQLGNCTWCWKKSDRKLLTLTVDHPEVFDFPARMEEKYGTLKAEKKAGREGVRRFFRGHRSVADLKALASTKPFKKWGENVLWDPTLDVAPACGESCEVYSDTDWAEAPTDD